MLHNFLDNREFKLASANGCFGRSEIRDQQDWSAQGTVSHEKARQFCSVLQSRREKVTPRAGNSTRVKDISHETKTVPFCLKPCPFSVMTWLPFTPRAHYARGLKRYTQMLCLNQRTKDPQAFVQKEMPLLQRQHFLTSACAKMDTVNGQLPLLFPPPPDSWVVCVTSWGSIP